MYYKNKFFIIGLLLFVTLLAISAVSAAENTTDIATVDLDMSGNEIQAYSNDDAVKQVNDRLAKLIMEHLVIYKQKLMLWVLEVW